MGSKTLTKPPKGTRDFLPEDVRRRTYVTDIIREVYASHGFLPLETPTLERLDTLLGKYGEEGDQLVFKVLRRGQSLVEGIREAGAHLGEEGALLVGRSGETAPGAEPLLADMGLRYDLTVPLARVYAQHQHALGPLLRRYQIQPVWRADRPGKGRFREFYQCDVDVVGSTSLGVEADVLNAVAVCLERLGFDDSSIRTNHRALLRAFIEVAGIDTAKESDAIVAIDKLDKVGVSGVAAELEAKGISLPSQKKLLELVTQEPSFDRLRGDLAEHPAGLSALDDLETLFDLVVGTPAQPKLRFDPTLARGLGYYTGAIFEIAVQDLAGSLGGGGRYDRLIGMFLGRDVPACGFSIGLERILVVMEERKMFPELPKNAEVIVAATDKTGLKEALGLACALRTRGLRAEFAPAPVKPGKVKKDALARGVSHVALLFPNEARALLWSAAEPDIRDRFVDKKDLPSHL